MDFIKRVNYFILGALVFLGGELNGLNAMDVNEEDIVQVDKLSSEENYSESEEDDSDSEENDKSGILKMGCHDYTCKQEVWKDKKKIPNGSYMVVSNENLFDKDPMTVYLPFCGSYEGQSNRLRDIRTEPGLAFRIRIAEETLNNETIPELRAKFIEELQFYTTVNNVNNKKKIKEMIKECTSCHAKLYEGNLNRKFKFICFVPYEKHCAERSILRFFKNSTERLCRECMIKRLKPHLLKIMNEKEITSYEHIIGYVKDKNYLDLPREHWSPNEFVDASYDLDIYGYTHSMLFHLFNYCAPKSNSSDNFCSLLLGNYKSSEVVPFINMVKVMKELLEEVKVIKKEEKKENKKKDKCVIF